MYDSYHIAAKEWAKVCLCIVNTHFINISIQFLRALCTHVYFSPLLICLLGLRLNSFCVFFCIFQLLSIRGSLTIRGTPLDALMMGLWLNRDNGGPSDVLEGHFDGFYTYFASDVGILTFASHHTLKAMLLGGRGLPAGRRAVIG